MEIEKFVSGYCRQLDASRMVMAVAQNGQLTEADCAYPDCPHTPSCPIAQALEDFIGA